VFGVLEATVVGISSRVTAVCGLRMLRRRPAAGTASEGGEKSEAQRAE
jgi:hypothetical protein